MGGIGDPRDARRGPVGKLAQWYDSLKELKNGQEWIWHPEKPIIFQNIILQKVQITIVKSELERLIRVYKTWQPELKTDVLKELQKILSPVIHLHNETRDQELG